MKTPPLKYFIISIVILSGLVFASHDASAQVTAPYLYFGGNYNYDAGTKQLTFSDNYVDWIEYINPFDDSFSDPIFFASVLFGDLTNSDSYPLVFSTSTFTVEGYFTATLSNFVVNDSELMWGSLSDIERLDGGSSRYVDELLAYGGGGGKIQMSFTPFEGGTENFTSTSTNPGAVGGIVAAPEPVSAFLFVAGGATLAARRYRRKKI